MIALIVSHALAFAGGLILGSFGLYLLAVALDPTAPGDHLHKRGRRP